MRVGDQASVTESENHRSVSKPRDSHPDHTPGVDGDTADTRIGWAFAIGQIVAMRNAVEKRP